MRYFVAVAVTAVLFPHSHLWCVDGIAKTKPITDSFRQSVLTSFQTKPYTISHFKSLLNPLLHERRVGTSEHDDARQYIVEKLESAGWSVEQDQFVENTVKGKLQFTNVKAKREAGSGSSNKYILLACHYDTKILPGNFIGATDAAVPCAMLLNIAEKFTLPSKESNGDKPNLELIFFDGEEALIQWTSTDSLYGSRHAVNKMKTTKLADGQTELSRIDTMILLDLIGSKDTNFGDYKLDHSQRHYEQLMEVERIFMTENCKGNQSHPQLNIFKNKVCRGLVDDHTPFSQEGVGTLPIVSCPFPSVWHTSADNANSLDHQLIIHILTIVSAYLDTIVK